MPTQIEKSQTFAVNFVAYVAIYQALKNKSNQPKEVQQQIDEAILIAIANHPNPAEA